MTTEFAPQVGRPIELLGSCPAYAPTSLASYELADGRCFLAKREDQRMRLGSFKALGGVYAVARLIEEACRRTGVSLLSGSAFEAEAVRAVASDMVFVCASAGNHGLSVATGTRIFGASSRIYLSAEVPEDFVNRLRKAGAEPIRAGATYQESIDAAMADAERTGAIHLADGSWPGYTRAPALVMEGYCVLAEEMRHTFSTGEASWPTDVFLQAGVGGLAAATAVMIRETWDVQPRIHVVEPAVAACLAASHKAGELTHAPGPSSSMGRLDCKDASMLAFNALEKCEVDYLQITEDQAAQAVADLKGVGIETTASGAAGFAGLRLLGDQAKKIPLVIISEGAVPS